MFIANCISIFLYLSTTLVQPGDILTVEPNQVDSTANVASELLGKARLLKLSEKSGHGAMYRRAAWASLEIQPPNHSLALVILDELMQQPESLFDKWDGLRIEARVYLAIQNDQLAAESYGQAELLAVADPSLIKSHPLVYIEIMQQQSAAYATSGDFLKAAQCAIRLRDHSNISIDSDHKLLAAQSACAYWLSAGNKNEYIDAWTDYKSLFPSSFASNQGVWLHIEHARNLSMLGDDIADHLEELFSNQELLNYNNYIEIGEELAWAWLEKDDSAEAQNFAYSTLQQTWNVVEERENSWLEAAGPLPLNHSPIIKQIKSFIGWYASMAYERDDFQTLESLGHAYGTRYGYEDGEAINMLNLSQNP